MKKLTKFRNYLLDLEKVNCITPVINANNSMIYEYTFSFQIENTRK